MNNEPTLDQIDDYNGNESPKKRNTIRLVVLLLIILGVFYSISNSNRSDVVKSEYIGTTENPGITIPNK